MSVLIDFEVNSLPDRQDGSVYCERPLTDESRDSLKPVYAGIIGVIAQYANHIDSNKLFYTDIDTLSYLAVARAFPSPLPGDKILKLRKDVVKTAKVRDEERFTSHVNVGVKAAELKAVRNQAAPLSSFCIRLCLDIPSAVHQELATITDNLPSRQVLDPRTKLDISFLDILFIPDKRSPIRDMQQEVSQIEVPESIQLEPWIIPRTA